MCILLEAPLAANEAWEKEKKKSNKKNTIKLVHYEMLHIDALDWPLIYSNWHANQNS